ncbi:hypothetical protein GXW82_14185 [Streptacidiphilus sp. 4-A2]|nr:hypothetical protein [Streptacidiphilus sp. 4-A2]
MAPGIVLLRGVLAIGAAILAVLAITPIIRDMLNVNAFQDGTSVNGGFPNSGALSAGVGIATLLAIVVLQLLQRVTPQPSSPSRRSWGWATSRSSA